MRPCDTRDTPSAAESDVMLIAGRPRGLAVWPRQSRQVR